ncbi:signal peptidase I [Janibacter sp. G1551]|uniref:signal peptidase I n=1 Tax=Janibacter sp. G1551 TaxID=3420440 RepID=UPI003D05B3E7
MSPTPPEPHDTAAAESSAAAVSRRSVGENATANETPAKESGRHRGARRPGFFSGFFGQLLIAFVVMALVRTLLVQSFYVPSGSMEPTILPGDRVIVNKLVSGDDLRRGDIIVFDGTDTFAADNAGASAAPASRIAGFASTFSLGFGRSDYIKRVVGLPGDRVVCCDKGGAITVNGEPITEPYLAPETEPSLQKFDVLVRPERLFVLGDNRGNSADSRAHLGGPGGGQIPFDDVVGRATYFYWPLDRIGGIDHVDVGGGPRS